MERMTGFEPATSTSARYRSSQLRPLRGKLLNVRSVIKHGLERSCCVAVAWTTARVVAPSTGATAAPRNCDTGGLLVIPPTR